MSRQEYNFKKNYFNKNIFQDLIIFKYIIYYLKGEKQKTSKKTNKS